MGLLNHLLDPHLSLNDPRVDLRQMQMHTKQKHVGGSQSRSGNVSMAPLSMRQHLMLYPQGLETAEAMSDERGVL